MRSTDERVEPRNPRHILLKEKKSGYQNFMEVVTSNTLNFSENRQKQGKKCNYHFGTLKKASKNVCMPSLFSWIINANPKRKKDR